MWFPQIWENREEMGEEETFPVLWPRIGGEDIEKWAGEIAAFAKVVEEFTGNEITVENLNEAIKVVNEKRKALARVYDCRKSKCLPISGRDALLMTQISFFDDPCMLCLKYLHLF